MVILPPSIRHTSVPGFVVSNTILQAGYPYLPGGASLTATSQILALSSHDIAPFRTCGLAPSLLIFLAPKEERTVARIRIGCQAPKH